jgi:2,4-dienoyl-CoA reductase-like NADH-dependent reductase (Old Yellow Enzyme family)
MFDSKIAAKTDELHKPGCKAGWHKWHLGRQAWPEHWQHASLSAAANSSAKPSDNTRSTAKTMHKMPLRM